TGDQISAERAGEIGLVDQVVEDERLREETMSLARTIGDKSPVALQAAKESILASRRMPLDQGLKFERGWFSLLFSTDDKEEGVDAFLEKRDPEFEGR
ncbi:MAG: enoyl-CoA hydratase-related protein, partial [Gemmatimonadota bacterium]